MGDERRIEVYTDGQCPLCQWSRARVESHDRDRRLEWLDYHDPAALARAAPLNQIRALEMAGIIFEPVKRAA